MKIQIYSLILALCLPLLHGQTITDHNEGSRIEKQLDGTFKFKWFGKSTRTYFVQISEDLETYTYVPGIIETGADGVINYGFSYSLPNYGDVVFLRLNYVNETSADPENADFDDDYLTNAEEINIYFTDPLNDDSDDDLLYDVDEVLWIGTDPNKSDTDDDLLSDYHEWVDPYNHGLDPLVPYANPALEDYDGDTLLNIDEINIYNSDPLNSDTDGDTLNDGDEINIYGTKPYWSDSDFDQMPDAYEVGIAGLDPTVNDGNDDPDGDLLLNTEEYIYGYNPIVADTDTNGTIDGNEDPDGDLLTNAQELYVYFTDPLNPDTDGDTLTDYEEVITYQTNPKKADSDNDGLPDAYEVQFPGFLDPNSNDVDLDADGDLLTNIEEYRLGLNPSLTDTDGNGTNDDAEDTDGDTLTNYNEIHTHGTNPGAVDTDNDELSDSQELALGLNPNYFDSDGDLFPDGWELNHAGFDPLVPADPNDPISGINGDADGDTISNLDELILGTDPTKADTDDDGFTDAEELAVGSYPTVPTDYPLN